MTIRLEPDGTVHPTTWAAMSQTERDALTAARKIRIQRMQAEADVARHRAAITQKRTAA